MIVQTLYPTTPYYTDQCSLTGIGKPEDFILCSIQKLLVWYFFLIFIKINRCGFVVLHIQETGINYEKKNSFKHFLRWHTQIFPRLDFVWLIQFFHSFQIEIGVQGFIFMLALLGNTIVLLALRYRKKKTSRMHLFIMHLSIADLLVAFCNVLPQMAWDITYQFQVPDFLIRLPPPFLPQSTISTFLEKAALHQRKPTLRK